MHKANFFNPVQDFFAFLRRPTADRVPALLRQKLLILAVIIALDILFGFTANLLSASIESFLPMQSEHVMDTEAELMRFMATLGILVIPFLEEVGFRLWLAPNLFFLFISFVLVTVQFAPVPFAGLLVEAGLEAAAPVVKVVFYLVLGAAIALFFWLRDRKGYRYTEFFNRYVAVYYYVSAIVFGLIHLTNYTSLGAWWYGPILVLPQLIGGFIFGYIRIRLGFWFAVLAHILSNLLYTLGDGMNALFGDAGGAVWLAILVLSATALVAWTFKKKPVTI